MKFRPSGRAVGVILGYVAFAGFAAYAYFALETSWAPPAPTAEQKAQDAAVIDFVDTMKRQGYVAKFDCDAGEAQIEPAFWNSIDMGYKRKTAAALRRYCGDKVLYLIDNHTGKRLGKVWWNGLEVE